MSRTVRLVSKSLAKQVDAQESDSVPYYLTSFPYSVFIILFPLNYGRIRTVGGSAIPQNFILECGHLLVNMADNPYFFAQRQNFK